MGVSVYSKNRSIDMGYVGFQRLRKTISELCPKPIAEHYAFLLDGLIYSSTHKEAYDAKTEYLYEKYRNTPYRKVIDFLYAPDTDADFGYGTAKALLKIIGDYDDDIVYGYAGWGDAAARFKDFRDILEEASINKRKWGWR